MSVRERWSAMKRAARPSAALRANTHRPRMRTRSPLLAGERVEVGLGQLLPLQERRRGQAPFEIGEIVETDDRRPPGVRGDRPCLACSTGVTVAMLRAAER